MSFSGCAQKQTAQLHPPRQAIPERYFAEVAGCSWDGDTTYAGVVRYAKQQARCAKAYKRQLELIQAWERHQQKLYDDARNDGE